MMEYAVSTVPLNAEWIEVNGTGSYASATVGTVLTRKYHGLLVDNLGPPAWGRHVLVNWVKETVETRDRNAIELAPVPASSTERSPEALYPSEFKLEPLPVWRFKLGKTELEKSLVMPYLSDVVILSYRVENEPLTLLLEPYISFRRNHILAERNKFMNTGIRITEKGCVIEPYEGMPPLHVVTGDGPAKIEESGEWISDIYYSEEEARGYPCLEDCFIPMRIRLTLKPGQTSRVAIGTTRHADIERVWSQELERRKTARQNVRQRTQKCRDTTLKHLIEALDLAAGAFLVQVPPDRQDTVLAGYHWFEDWGRDTMIALPGVAFCRGENCRGLNVIKTFCKHLREGRIPNFIGPAGGEPAYNSVDGSLWLFWAVQQYLEYSGNPEDLYDDIWPALKDVIKHFAAATRQDAKMCEDGRLYCGSPETQLTWMDAAPGGRPVTPRWGHPIEINALWYNALAFANELAAYFGDSDYVPPCSLENLAATLQKSYWLAQKGYIADNINEAGIDCRLRPNQLFAISLPHTAFSVDQARKALNAVRTALLTPRGMRTLDPGDPEYRGRCAGDVAKRDVAYHQGTVWPWLSGAFGEAWLKLYPDSEPAKELIVQYLKGWEEHLSEAGLGTVSEIFDGDPPHTPRGCIAQAWSVAELLRLARLVCQA